MADAMSADASGNPAVRRTLRNRARYEFANNSFAKGIGLTIANDVVGTGPRLQYQCGDKATNTAVEDWYHKRAREIRLNHKLWALRLARYQSGEAFAVSFTNPKLRGPSKADIRILEPDHVTGTMATVSADPALYTDGIRYDQYGNPDVYEVARNHPGGGVGITLPSDVDQIRSEFVFHYFRSERPGQRRGIADIVPALPLFAMLRRYTLATVAAAETAANHAGVLYTDQAAEEAPATVAPYDLVELERNGAVTLPNGWKLGQLKPEQPTTTYPAFVDALLREIARCLEVPFALAAMDSSKANMSSRYMDASVYERARTADREDFDYLLDWDFEHAYQEARNINKWPADGYQVRWFWPAINEHADPSKVARGIADRMRVGISNPGRECADIGLDVEAEFEAAAKTLGVSIDEYRKMVRESIFEMNKQPAPAEQNGEPQAATSQQ